MLKIRPAQMEALAHAALRNFEDRMLAHLRRCGPGLFRILTEGEVREVVRYGRARARAHGLTSERSVRLYVEVMLTLGSNFDADPQFPWAAEILADGAAPDEAARIDRLSDKAWDYADAVRSDYVSLLGGGRRSRPARELRELRRAPPGAPAGPLLPELYQRALPRLERMLPRKYEYVGEVGLRRLVARAVETAAGYGLDAPRDALLFVELMFVLGGGFDADPLLPWASAALKETYAAGRRERVERLSAGALDCLARWSGPAARGGS